MAQYNFCGIGWLGRRLSDAVS